MKFDVHCHAFPSHGYIPGGGKLGDPYFLSVEQQLQMFEDHGVDMGLLLPLIHYEIVPYPQTVKEIEETAKKYPDKFLYFMSMDPRMMMRNPKADFSRYIEYHLERGAKGVGEMCVNLPWEHPLMDNMLSCINKYKLPLTIHMTHNEFCDYGIRDDMELSGLERAAQKWKDITFLCHSADFWNKISGEGPQTGYPTDKVQPGGRVVELMRKYPNIHGDLSAGSGLNAIMRDREFGIAFLNEFQDKLYFGQDYCSLSNNMMHSEYLDELIENGEISQEVYDKVCWKNAVKLLGLDLTEDDFKL